MHKNPGGRDTEYYALEMHVHMQLLASPLRVHSVEAADLVYVPLWASQLVMRLVGQGACKPNWTEPAVDALMADFWADAPALLPALGRKPHWMALSEIEWGFRRGCGEGWGVPLMCHPLARDIMFASPEARRPRRPACMGQGVSRARRRPRRHKGAWLRCGRRV